MKTIPLLAAACVLAATASAGDNEPTVTITTKNSLQTREVPRAANRGRVDEPVRVADARSANAFAWFAANQIAGAAIDYAGMHFSMGGGYARMKTGGFSRVTAYNETLPATDTSDSVWFGRAELGYQFGENWDLSFAYTHFTEAEVQIAFPKYPNIVSVVPLPDYKRHVMKYRIKRLSLMPTYRQEVGDRVRFGIGAGVTCNWTTSHIEATFRQWFVGMDNSLITHVSQSEDYTSWGGIVSLNADYALLKHLTLSLGLAYAPASIKLPSDYASYSQGASKNTRDTVRVDTFEAALTLSSRW